MERTEDLGLDVNMAFYRTYDPAIGRWWQVDREAEAFYHLSPYNGLGNNPIRYVDTEGDFIRAIVSAVRVVVRAAKAKKRYGKIKGGVKGLLKAEGRSLAYDAGVIFGRGEKFGRRLKAAFDVITGLDLVKSAADAQASIEASPAEVVRIEEDPGSEKASERAKTLDQEESATNQEAGITTAQEQQQRSKDGRSLVDEDSEWAGAKKKPKSTRINKTDKSNQKAKNNRKRKKWFN